MSFYLTFLLLSTVLAKLQRDGTRPHFPKHSTVPWAPMAPADVINVLDFGAVGDGNTDNTNAFNQALQKAGQTPTGAPVYAPPGQYRFNGHLTFPKGVSLLGSYQTVPSHGSFNGAAPKDGTVLLPYENKGNPNGPAFIALAEDCTLKGVVIYYPEQLWNSTSPPLQYPYSISMSGNNPSVEDVELLNSFNGISAVQAHRHYLARIQGQPINLGIFVDQTYDIGRIEDVHWNPYWSSGVQVTTWSALYGRAFVIARTDWEYVLNTFAFGYAIGYHFIKSSDGACNGNFLGIGMDLAFNASVQVDGAQGMGILITNGEFTAFTETGRCPTCTASPTQIVMTAQNTGPLRIVNSAFWGPTDHIAVISGTGLAAFSSCEFAEWDGHNKGYPAIQVNSGSSVSVQGSQFQENKPKINLASGVKKAVIIGNILAGSEGITDGGAANLQKGYNAFG